MARALRIEYEGAIYHRRGPGIVGCVRKSRPFGHGLTNVAPPICIGAQALQRRDISLLSTALYSAQGYLCANGTIFSSHGAEPLDMIGKTIGHAG